MTPDRAAPPRAGDRRARRPASAAVVVLLVAATTLTLLVAGALLPAGAAPATAAGQEQVPVVVVRTPAQNGGSPDSLAQIAERTLDDPDRAEEVFALNEGRQQADGEALTSSDRLNPGWVLRLPEDASGPDVRQGAVTGSPDEQADEQADAGGGEGVLRVPVVIAVVAGVLLAVATALIVLRRRVVGGGRALVDAVAAAVRRLGAPRAARRRRARRREMAGRWRADEGSALLARAALDDASRAVALGAGATGRPGAHAALRPMAAEVGGGLARVHGLPSEQAAAPWTAGGGSWTRPLTGMAVPGTQGASRHARLGGDGEVQLFLDLERCADALCVDGDAAVAAEVVASLAHQLARADPALAVVAVGGWDAGALPERTRSPGAGGAGAPVGAGDPDRAAAPSPALPGEVTGPFRAAAPARALTGVLLVHPSVSPAEREELVGVCAAAGSTWLGLVAGDVPGAHWRVSVDRAGDLRLPLLRSTVVAVA